MDTNADATPREVAENQAAAPEGHQFDVFLSYSRKDEEFGKKLEQALEDYRLPKNVKTGLGGKNRLSVFRDKNDLVPTDSDYYKTIAGYLKRSAYLIVICSPNARKSKYVNKEIEDFLQVNEAKRLIPVLLSGKPNNESADSPEECAFPEALCRALEMPLALPFTDFQRSGGKVNRGRYHDSWYTLLAKIFGAERAVIERLDAKRQARRRAVSGAISVSIIALLSVALLFALASRNRAIAAEGRAVAALKDAEEQRNQALKAKGEAEYQRNQAESQRLLAVEAAEEARRQKEEAVKQRTRAEEQTKVATEQRTIAQQQAQLAREQRQRADEERREAVSQRDRAQRLLYASSMSLAQQTYEDNDSERAQELLKGFMPAGSEDSRPTTPTERVGGVWSKPTDNTTDMRGFEWYYLWRLASRKLAAFELGGGTAPPEPVPTPDAGDSSTYRPPEDFYVGRTVRPVAFSRSGDDLFVATGGDNVVSAWRLSPHVSGGTDAAGRGGKPPQRLPNHGEAVRAISLVGGNIVATAGREQIKLWRWPAGGDTPAEPLVAIELRGSSHHIALDSSEGGGDGPQEAGGVLAIGRASTFWMWDARAPQKLTLLRAGARNGFASVAFVGKGKALITCDGTNLTRWDVATRQPAKIELLREGKRFEVPFIASMAFTPDARTMVTVSGRSFMVWAAANADSTAYELKKELPAHSENFFRRSLYADLVVAISPDGRLLATGDGTDVRNGGGVKLWDIEGGEIKEMFNLGPDVLYATSLAFSKDGKTLAVGGEGGAQWWDVSERKPFVSPGAAQELPRALEADRSLPRTALSPEGKSLATSGSPYGVTWSDAGSKSPEQFFHVGTVVTRAMSFSPDGKMLAVGGGGDEADEGLVTLWDALTRKEIEAKIVGHRGVSISVTSIAFSPDGKVIATGATDKLIELWDIGTVPGRLLVTLAAHKSPVTALAFSGDGKTMASADAGGTVNLWSTNSHQLLLTLKAASLPIATIAFSKNSDTLFTRDEKGEIRLWPAAPREQAGDVHRPPPFAAAPEAERRLDPSGNVAGAVNALGARAGNHVIVANDDMNAQLDIFVTELRGRPAERGYVICYGGRRSPAGEARALCDSAKEYLVNVRGVDAKRLFMIDGGLREHRTFTLWLVPPGADPPTPEPTFKPR